MESIYPELALCGSKNECARTDTVFFPIFEVSDGTVSLIMEGKHQLLGYSIDHKTVLEQNLSGLHLL